MVRPEILSVENIKLNVKNLKNYYRRNMDLREIDESMLLKENIAVHTPKTKKRGPFKKSVSSIGRVLLWDPNPAPRPETLRAPPNFIGISTPMTMAMEINHWLQDLIDSC